MDGPARLVRTAIVFYAVLAAVAVAWRVGLQGQSLLLAAPGDRVHWLRDPLLGAGSAALVIGLSSQLTTRTRAGEALARALAAVIGPLELPHCVVLGLASGIGEETLFRGALQPRVGLVWASVLFALAHVVPRRDLLPWAGFALAAGFLLGGLYAGTGNLVAPIVAHVVVNAVNLRRLARDYGPG